MSESHIATLDRLERNQEIFEKLRRSCHRRGDHDGQRAMEFALEQIRLVQMATPSASETPSKLAKVLADARASETYRRESEALSANVDRSALIHEKDCPKVWDFYKRYALGSKRCPSCLMCGQQRPDRAEWAITHMELPDVYICKPCVDAKAAVSASGWISVNDRMPPQGEIVRVAGEHRLNTDAMYQDGTFWAWSSMHEDWAAALGIVSHWMPLPSHPSDR